MFVILLYDINEKRVKMVSKIAQKYLLRVQMSVYHGYLTHKQLERLKSEIRRCIVPSEDSVCIYSAEQSDFLQMEMIGKPKETEQIIL